MKKKRLLAAILIACSAFLGAGYGWWTDTLVIDGTVSTGEFKVAAIESKMFQGKVEDDENKLIDITGKSCSRDGENVLIYNMEDLFPGTMYSFEGLFRNDGSIPAVIDGFVINIDSDTQDEKGINEDFLKQLSIQGEVYIESTSGNDEEKRYTIPSETSLLNFSEKLNEEIDKNNWKLEPGDLLVFSKCIITFTGEVYDGIKKENKFEGEDITLNLQIAFKQHNQQ